MFSLPQSEDSDINFLQDKGVLAKEMRCRENHAMYRNKLRWICARCEQQKGLRTNSWLENTKLPCLTVVRFLYAWSQELTSLKWCATELSMSPRATVTWNGALRDVCAAALERRPDRKIGGPGLIVEIDETMFSKRKNHAAPTASPPRRLLNHEPGRSFRRGNHVRSKLCREFQSVKYLPQPQISTTCI